jgi:hypothetical protein
MRTLRPHLTLDAGVVVGPAAACVLALPIAWAIADPIGRGPQQGLLLPGAAAVALLVAAVLARPVLVLALACCLLAVVPSDPAPVDVVFCLLIVTTTVTARITPAVPATVSVPLVIFSSISLVSLMAAPDLPRAITFEFTTLYLVGLAVWLTWVFRSRVATRVAIQAYLVGAAASGVAAAAALYIGFPGSTALLYDASRAEALFKDPNVFGPFLVPAAAVLLEELARPRLLTWPRALVVAAFVGSTIGVVVAFSRAGWLNYTLAIGTVVVTYVARRTGLRNAGRALAWLILTGLAGVTLLAATGSLTFLEQRSGTKAYDQQRFSSQAEAFDELDRTAIGRGPGQTEIGLPISTHSVYARTAYEQGAIGLAAIVLVFIGTLLGAWRLARDDLDVHGIGGAALLGSWLGLMANGAFVDTLHWRHLWFVAALVWFGAAQAATRRLADGTGRRP